MWKRWLSLMVIGLVALLGLFAYQAQTTSWQSSLLDTLPADANPYHRAYQASQQPNEQQILLWLQVPVQDAEALREAVESGLLELAAGQPEITPNTQLALAPMLDFYRKYSGSFATPHGSATAAGRATAVDQCGAAETATARPGFGGHNR